MTDSGKYIIDQLLVMDAWDGDAEAMEKLVHRWQKRLWHYAYCLTSHTQAAWDITQQTWLGYAKTQHQPRNKKAGASHR